MVVSSLAAGAPAPSWAAISTAVASGVTALGGLILAFAVLIPSLKTTRDTHKIVNQQRTDSINYQNALIRALRAKGIDIPRDQSQPNGGDEHGAT